MSVPRADSERFAFGKNWSDYIAKHFSEERLALSQKELLQFLGVADLKGLSFIDIGSGSGLHSLAAFRAGAERIHSFDYDPLSVETTRQLWRMAGEPAHWTVERGSVLDRAYLERLGRFDIVYSWGVLHHTGAMWQAVRNLAPLIKRPGRVYLALYATEKHDDPTPSYWLDLKQRYNRAGWLQQRFMEVGYIWRFLCGRSIRLLLAFPRMVVEHKQLRGMNLYTDIKDWLGGWPMEFAAAHEVAEIASEQLGLEAVQVQLGKANTEYLFTTRGDSSVFGLRPLFPDGKLPQILSLGSSEPEEVASGAWGSGVWIYGTGSGGSNLYDDLRHKGISVLGFIDSYKSGEMKGLPIRSFEDFKRTELHDTPLIVASQEHSFDIINNLLREGFYRIYNARVKILKLAFDKRKGKLSYS
ncbi:methyltransferase domain-containing protein [Azospirillum endophyticum]